MFVFVILLHTVFFLKLFKHKNTDFFWENWFFFFFDKIVSTRRPTEHYFHHFSSSYSSFSFYSRKIIHNLVVFFCWWKGDSFIFLFWFQFHFSSIPLDIFLLFFYSLHFLKSLIYRTEKQLFYLYKGFPNIFIFISFFIINWAFFLFTFRSILRILKNKIRNSMAL